MRKVLLEHIWNRAGIFHCAREVVIYTFVVLSTFNEGAARNMSLHMNTFSDARVQKYVEKDAVYAAQKKLQRGGGAPDVTAPQKLVCVRGLTANAVWCL